MTLAALVDAVLADPVLSGIRDGEPPPAELVAPAAARPLLVAGLAGAGAGMRAGAQTGAAGAGAAAGSSRLIVAVTATGREAEDLTESLTCLLDPDAVALYPSWETLPHERLSPRADTVGRRLAVLHRLAHPAGRPLRVVVAPVRSMLQPQIAGLGDLQPVTLRPGDETALEDVVARLSHFAYTRVELVERRGEFAVRGGILDVFPPPEEHPVRVEFFGDTVDEVRHFAVADQRSLGVADAGLWAPACRELLLTDEVRATARDLADAHPELSDILDRLAEGIPTEGMEAFAPVLAERLTLLVHELPAGTQIVACDPERVRTRAGELVRTSQEFLDASWSAAAFGGRAPVDLAGAAYLPLADVQDAAAAAGTGWCAITPFTSDTELQEGTAVPALRAAPEYRGDTEAFLADVRTWLSESWRVVLVTEGHGPAQRLVELLRDGDIAARLTEDAELVGGLVTVTCGQLTSGLVSRPLGLAVVTETDLAGQRGVSTKDMRRMPSRRRRGIDPLQLKPGEAVVHEHHGVGRYLEMVTRTVNGGRREYLVIAYARDDKLYVPTDQLELVSRYVGGEAPTLDRIGGSDWAKRKGRARKAVREIAAELIRLYSARMASPGHAFGPDTPWQRELEDAFPYRETPDQLAAIDEVKADMEEPVPMDRVICGDVGYGKTEIAVRAAFKAVMDGKQVAVLVPTTLLGQQHLSTFKERFAPFPVKVAAASRFNTVKEQQAAVEGVADGTVDVVIGTHRLLSASTRFKNLGLIIVDEEQRFGVEHKEFLKHMRTAVDVLTMSATPIPRTLEMSITGIRELSTIDTPPEERHPVLTFVGPHQDNQIAAAIRRELLREGQVFFIHNRVESIDRAAKRLRDMVPEARVAVAHGQMHEDALEQVMIGFWEKRFDVLVCTTIVESGLDIPNANTLVVERADVMGLSQLHQLRGRVGRGRERAYAYFLYPMERPLTETAHDRLATIAQNSELGSGMAVAMKDLEIRGAGNLLGGQQSGHIAAVGFDLYVRLVGEAVADFKGTKVEELAEVKVELPVNASLPHDYVPSERLRLEAYRRLASAASEADLTEVRAELLDRYGPLPEPVESLLAVAAFRVLARGYGLAEVTLQGKYIRCSPLELRESQTLRLQRLYKGSIVKAAAGQVLVPLPTTTGRLGAPQLRDRALLDWCGQLLDVVAGDIVAAATPA